MIREGSYITKKLTIFSDGGARGNPGHAAIAFLAFSTKGQLLKKYSSYIGYRTNNQAEYEALIAGLKFALSVGAEEVSCFMDSQLVTKQLSGEYAVRNFELQKLWIKIQDLKKDLSKVRFTNVPRNNPSIEKADQLLNETLDREELLSK